jgi:RNA polymerase sigma factor (sigma-70 family)
VKKLAHLVRQAQTNDLGAYNQIVRRFQDMAVTYAYSLLSDFHLAEDVAQEAFVAAYLDLPKLKRPEAFPGWFRRIVHNRCGRFTRGKRLLLVSLDEVDAELTEQKNPAELFEEQEMVQRVQTALQILPEHERSVVMLYYIGQFTQNKIASFLSVPETTVINRLRSSRTKLKKEWINMTQEDQPLHSTSEKFADEIHKQLQALRVLHEKLCSMTTDLFSKALSQKTDIKVIDVDQVTYAEFICGLALCHPITNPSMTITFLLKPLEGRMTFDMSLPLVYAILHKGEKIPAETEVRWQSDWPSGDEIKELYLPFLDKAFKHLMASWESTLEVNFWDGEYSASPTSLLEYPDYPSDPDHKERMDLPKPSDKVFRVCMSVKSGDLSEELNICYPAQALQSVL